MPPSDPWTLPRAFVLSALLCFSLHAFVIDQSARGDGWIDLKLYMEAGSMQSQGLNPYDFHSRAAERAALRLDPHNFDPFACETQARWDYYVSGNLPASTVLYGAVDRVAPSAKGYRRAFALLDALTAGLIAVLVLAYWPIERRWLRLLVAVGLGPLNPVLLKWGAFLPEDKGAQIGLMLGAYLAARSTRPVVRFHLSALLLGTSMAYKLFGVFLVPVCLWYAVAVDERLAPRRALGYLALTGAAFFVWFVPYLPQVLDPLLARLVATGSPARPPAHAGAWLPLWTLLGPGAAGGARLVFTLGLLAAGLTAFVRTRTVVGLTTCCTDALVAFGCAWLVEGGLTRYNIVLVSAICLTGTRDLGAARVLTALYACYYPILLGTVVFPRFLGRLEVQGVNLDGYFVLAFLLCYCAVRAVRLPPVQPPVTRTAGAEQL